MAPIARLFVLAGFVVAMWIVYAFDWLTGASLTRMLGLIPREVAGLDGILFMPILHGSPAHLISNTVPLLVMGGLLALTATRALIAVNAVIVGGGGAGTWLFGSSAIHIGASGLVFGWFGFLVARGLIDRSPITLGSAAVVGVLYGALLWGVLPGRAGVSWEAHLFGFLAGIAAAWIVPARVHEPSLKADP